MSGLWFTGPAQTLTIQVLKKRSEAVCSSEHDGLPEGRGGRGTSKFIGGAKAYSIWRIERGPKGRRGLPGITPADSVCELYAGQSQLHKREGGHAFTPLSF